MLATLCFVALLFASCMAAKPQDSPYEVIGMVRNEFLYDLSFLSASLDQGTWTSPPVKTIAAGSTYVNAFSASGPNGVVGTVNYVVQVSGFPTPPSASFFFLDVAGNQTFTTKACCSPFIGGVGEKTGDDHDITYQFWTHQMCAGDACKK